MALVGFAFASPVLEAPASPPAAAGAPSTPATGTSLDGVGSSPATTLEVSGSRAPSVSQSVHGASPKATETVATAGGKDPPLCYPNYGWNTIPGEFPLGTIYPVVPVNQPLHAYCIDSQLAVAASSPKNTSGIQVPDFETLNLTENYSGNTFPAEFTSVGGVFSIYLPATSLLAYRDYDPCDQPLNPQCNADVYFDDIWTTIVGLGNSSLPATLTILTPDNTAVNMSTYGNANQGNTADVGLLLDVLSVICDVVCGPELAVPLTLDFLSFATDLCATASNCEGATQNGCMFPNSVGPTGETGGTATVGECEALDDPQTDGSGSMASYTEITLPYGTASRVPFGSDAYLEVNAQDEQFNGSMAGGSSPFYYAGSHAEEVLPISNSYGIGGYLYGSNGQPIDHALVCFDSSEGPNCNGVSGGDFAYTDSTGYWHFFGHPGTAYYAAVRPVGGCTASDPNALPVPAAGTDSETVDIVAGCVSTSTPSGAARLDLGQSVTFTATGLDPTGAFDYAWSYPSGLGCTASTSTVLDCTPTATGSYAPSVTITNTGTGGGDVVATASTLTVYGDPSATTPTASPTTVTVGASVTFSTTASGGSGSYKYAWGGLPTGCTSSNAASFSCTPTAAGSYSVYVTVTDTSDYSVKSGSLAFTVTAPPTYTVSFSESGLPSGDTWSATVGSTSKSASAGSTITFTGLSGSNSYEVGEVVVSESGCVIIYYAPSPSSGTVTGATHVSVTYTEKETVALPDGGPVGNLCIDTVPAAGAGTPGGGTAVASSLAAPGGGVLAVAASVRSGSPAG